MILGRYIVKMNGLKLKTTKSTGRREGSKEGVLVSAGTELILFLVTGTVLCFGFSVRIVLITH